MILTSHPALGVVRENKVCIRRLFEKDAEIHTKDDERCNMAAELKSLGAWKRALEEVGLRRMVRSERNRSAM